VILRFGPNSTMSARSIKEGRLPHMPTILNYVARRNSPRESVSSLRVCSIPFHLAKKEYSNGCASAETIPMHHFRNKEFVIDFVIGVILLVVSLMVETRAVTYVDNQTSNAVSDIVLNNTRVFLAKSYLLDESCSSILLESLPISIRNLPFLSLTL